MGGDAFDLPNGPAAGGNLARWLQGGRDDEKKKASVEAELERVKRLPARSTYATHRTRVLNKILHLMSVQRTHSQNEELELLFAGLSL